MIKMIAIDLDGTLLDDNKKISMQNKIAIKQAKNMGAKIIIASGRPYFRVKEILKKLTLNEPLDYVITYNGGAILLGDGSKKIYESKLKNKDIIQTIDFINKYNGGILLYQDDHIFCFHFDKNIASLKVFAGINFEEQTVEKLKSKNMANKIILADNGALIDKVKEKLPKKFKKNYNIVRSTNNFLEFLPKKVSKGIAIKKLATMFKISKNEIMVIGDEENDLSMFSYAKVKVAMGNASVSIKAHASYITTSNNDSGVAQAIEYFLINKKN